MRPLIPRVLSWRARPPRPGGPPTRPGGNAPPEQPPPTHRRAAQTPICLALLPMRLAMRPTVTRGPVVSYTAVSPLPVEDGRSVLCCAISQVTLGGRYPPSCSMEPGSSSADPNEDHGRGHQEVSSLQLYIRCGKGGIPPCGEAMTLPGYPVFSMVGHSWTIRERRAEYRMGRVGRVAACRMETNQICKSLVCARKSKKTLPIHCSIYHDEQTSQPDKPVSNLLIGDCCQSPSIYIVSLQRKAREQTYILWASFRPFTHCSSTMKHTRSVMMPFGTHIAGYTA